MLYHDILKGCFQVDPNQRFDTSMILERLGAISETKNWSVKGTLDIKGKSLDSPPSQSPMHTSQNNHAVHPPRPAPPNLNQHSHAAPPRPDNRPPQRPVEPPKIAPANQPASQYNPNAISGGSSLFSSIRGGAGSFLKNLKDTSSKVMQTVQQSMGRTDLDISYITQKVIVMPCPSEGLESAYKTNNIEDVKLYLESRHPPSKISVYNFGHRSCPRLPPPVRTVEGAFVYQSPAQKAPVLNGMYSLAEDMYGFLNADPKNVVVIQSPDNSKSATMVSSLLNLTSVQKFNEIFNFSLPLCWSMQTWSMNLKTRCKFMQSRDIHQI